MATEVLTFPEHPCNEGIHEWPEDVLLYCVHGAICQRCHRHTTEEPDPEHDEGILVICPIHGRVGWMEP